MRACVCEYNSEQTVAVMQAAGDVCASLSLGDVTDRTFVFAWP